MACYLTVKKKGWKGKGRERKGGKGKKGNKERKKEGRLCMKRRRGSKGLQVSTFMFRKSLISPPCPGEEIYLRENQSLHGTRPTCPVDLPTVAWRLVLIDYNPEEERAK